MDNERTDFATKGDLNALDTRLSTEIKENREYIDTHSREIARLEAVYKSLESLPNTILNLDKTITVIGSNLESMDRNLNDVRRSVSNQEHAIKELKGENSEQNKHIERIDNKSKIDWAEFITSNFWKIFLAFGAVYVVVELLLNRGV